MTTLRHVHKSSGNHVEIHLNSPRWSWTDFDMYIDKLETVRKGTQAEWVWQKSIEIGLRICIAHFRSVFFFFVKIDIKIKLSSIQLT